MKPETKALTQVLAAMVQSPDRLLVTETVRGCVVHITIKTWQRDQPRLIGKQGQNINAITTICQHLSTPEQTFRVHLEEPTPEGTPGQIHEEKPIWDVFTDLCSVLGGSTRELRGVATTTGGADEVFTVFCDMPGHHALATALGMVFRAIGRVRGVNIEIEWSAGEGAHA